jgi:hypothetical protein
MMIKNFSCASQHEEIITYEWKEDNHSILSAWMIKTEIYS